MNEPKIERPSPLTFDLDQWRSDIQTFAEETSSELQQIIAELSGEETCLDLTPFISSPFIANSPNAESNAAPSNQRLTSLKEKLAERITSPNQ